MDNKIAIVYAGELCGQHVPALYMLIDDIGNYSSSDAITQELKQAAVDIVNSACDTHYPVDIYNDTREPSERADGTHQFEYLVSDPYVIRVFAIRDVGGWFSTRSMAKHLALVVALVPLSKSIKLNTTMVVTKPQDLTLSSLARSVQRQRCEINTLREELSKPKVSVIVTPAPQEQVNNHQLRHKSTIIPADPGISMLSSPKLINEITMFNSQTLRPIDTKPTQRTNRRERRQRKSDAGDMVPVPVRL